MSEQGPRALQELLSFGGSQPRKRTHRIRYAETLVTSDGLEKPRCPICLRPVKATKSGWRHVR